MVPNEGARRSTQALRARQATAVAVVVRYDACRAARGGAAYTVEWHVSTTRLRELDCTPPGVGGGVGDLHGQHRGVAGVEDGLP